MNMRLTLIITILLFFSGASSTAESPARCEFSPHPKLCSSMVSSAATAAVSYDLHSIQTALRITALARSRLPDALEDCHHLFGLNADILASVAEDLRSMKSSATASLVHRVRTRLSAVTANHRTCHDGLVDEGAPEMAVVARAGKIYGVTLGLVTQALSPAIDVQMSSRHHGHHHHRPHHHSHRHHRSPTLPPPKSPPPPPPPLTLPPPPPTANSNSEHHTQDGPHSLTDIIKGLKKSRVCSSSSPECGKLMLPGLIGNGILVNDSVIVSQDGTGDFRNIKDAVESAPMRLRPQDGYFVIYIKAGVYAEYVRIPAHKQSVLLLGDGVHSTIITGEHSNATGWSTFRSATFTVEGDNFIAIDVTFRNTAGPEGGQAVAVMNQADRSAFFRCSIEGYQDTLYAQSRTQFYRDCHIIGTVDFICGDASAVFQNSFILGRKGQSFTVAAQNRDLADENSGFVFHNCTVDSERKGTSSGGFLGRPWRQYARTVYMQSEIGAAIEPHGWREMSGHESLGTLYYAEFQNTGPGSATGSRVPWTGVFKEMSLSEALSFTLQNFTDAQSWLPFTDIPFTPGLL